MATKKSIKAAAATTGLFVTEQTETKPEKNEVMVEETTGKADRAKKETAAEQKKELDIFSVRIDRDILLQWKSRTSVDGYGKIGELTEAALTEYMNRHKLTPEQEETYTATYNYLKAKKK